jgi:hypothetical protein
LVFRELGIETMDQDLGVSTGLDRSSPAILFSLDLTLQCLPDLHRLARAAATHDPLVSQLETIGRWAPLSSVGVRLDNIAMPAALVEHPGLSRLYVDRIVAARAFERLDRPQLMDLGRLAVSGGLPGDETLMTQMEALGCGTD